MPVCPKPSCNICCNITRKIKEDLRFLPQHFCFFHEKVFSILFTLCWWIRSDPPLMPSILSSEEERESLILQTPLNVNNRALYVNEQAQSGLNTTKVTSSVIVLIIIQLLLFGVVLAFGLIESKFYFRDRRKHTNFITSTAKEPYLGAFVFLALPPGIFFVWFNYWKSYRERVCIQSHTSTFGTPSQLFLSGISVCGRIVPHPWICTFAFITLENYAQESFPYNCPLYFLTVLKEA